MNVTPNTLVSQVAAARAARVVPFGGDRLAFTSQTGVTRVVRGAFGAVEYDFDNCPDLRKYGEHVLSDVEADLPGDRSVGFCVCRKYIDTGTWDERNA
jgi:hypothetical protein